MSTRRVSRREFLQMSALTGAGVVLAACAQPTAAPPTAAPVGAATSGPTVAPPSAGAVVTIHTIDQLGLTGEDAIKEIHANFLAANPNLRIERATVPPGPEETWQGINAALASADPPEIFFTSGRGYVVDFAKKGTTVDLTDDINSWGFEFAPAAQQMAYKGRYYATPYWIQFKYFTYYKPLYDKLGLSIPTTWNDWLSTCDALKAAGYTPCAFGCQAADIWAALNWTALFNQKFCGLKTVIDDMDVDIGRWEDPGYEKALEYVADLNDKEFFGVNPVSRPAQVAQAKMLSGEAGAYYSGSWDIAVWRDPTKAPEKFMEEAELQSRIWHDPSWPGEENAVQGGTMGWSLVAKSKNKDEAKQLLKYYTSAEGMTIFGKHTGYIMMNKASKPGYTEPKLLKLTSDVQNSAGMFDFIDQSGDPTVWRVYGRQIEGVINREITPKQAMEEVRKSAKEQREKAG